MTPESFRKSKDWTQADLGEALGGLSKGYISTLESGNEWPLELALKLQLVSEGQVLARDLVDADKRALIDQLTPAEPVA